MKTTELEQLRKDINARIDAIIKNEDFKTANLTEEDFVKGRWYYTDRILAKFSNKGDNNFGFIRGEVTENITMEDPLEWNILTDFTELTGLLKAEVIKLIGKGKPIGVRDVEAREMNKFSSDYKKDYANLLGEMTDYNPDTDTLYAIGYGITIVYENGVFATVQQEDKGAVLIEQAKKMGFKEGVKYHPATLRETRVISGEFKYNPNWGGDECLHDDGFVIWDSIHGWATIIQEPIIIDGKEVEIKNTYVRINDFNFSIKQIECFQSLNPIFTEILKRMEEKNGSDNQQGEK